MTPDPVPAPTTPTAPSATDARPSMLAAVLAALVPPAYAVTGLGLLFVGVRTTPLRLVQESGWVAWLVLAALFLGAIACAVLAFLAARGVRVPTAASVFVAALPWLLGLAGLRLSMRMVTGAVANADPSYRAMMEAQGLSEAIGARVLGAWSTATLASALALSLAVGAAGQRATNRKWALAAVGFLLALPLLLATGWAFFDGRLGRAGLLPILCALGALVTLPIAAGAPAGDAPHGRAAALASAAVPVTLLAWLATLATTSAATFREAFADLASVDASARTPLLAEALSGLRVVTVLGWVGGATLVLAAVVVAAWAASRARPSVGVIVGGVAVLVLVGATAGLDAFARAASEREAAGAVRTPWSAVAGFHPVHIVRGSHHEESVTGAPWVLAVDGLHADGADVSTAELATEAGVARVAALAGTRLRADQASPFGEAPDYLDEPGPRDVVVEMPGLAVAIDARVGAAALAGLARGAERAGAHSLAVSGRDVREDIAAHMTVAELSPAVGALLDPPIVQSWVLPRAVAGLGPDADPTLWHVTVDAEPSGTIAARAGSTATPLRYDADAIRDMFDAAPPPTDEAVYVQLGPTATAASFAAAASAATDAGRWPVIVVDELPGHPDQPLANANAGFDALRALMGDPIGDDSGYGGLGRAGGSGEGTIGLGILGTLGHGGGALDDDGPIGIGAGGLAHPGTQVQLGSGDVRGSLSREVIQRVIRRNVNQVRYCYEQLLQHDPRASGRVVVSFVISATGAVVSSSVQSSTLGDTDTETCIAAAVRRWTFPPPEGGGIVIVNYPFELTSDPGQAPSGPNYGVGAGT